MKNGSQLFLEYYQKFISSLKSVPDPLIIFPQDVRKMCNPFRVVLLKIIENNPDFVILLDEGITDIGKELRLFGRASDVCLFVLNKQIIFMDYSDNSQIRNSPSKYTYRFFEPEHIGGIVKFQYGTGLYDKIPCRVYPFIYPGSNDYKKMKRGIPYYDPEPYREIFSKCCADGSFESSIFARWAHFKRRRKYTDQCQNIPNSDVHFGKRVSFYEYMDKISRSKFGIVARGNGKWSHREMEIASIGVPMFFESSGGEMLKPFIAGTHYIPVNKHDFMEKFRYYDEHYDEALAIGQAAQGYYNSYHRQRGIQSLFKDLVSMIIDQTPWPN